jgi:excisionase family DNA binding protein
VAVPVEDSHRDNLLADLFGGRVPLGVGERLLRTSDVATLFQVSERTVSEWARRGRVPSVRTPGGHRRYPAEQIRQLFTESRHGPTGDAADGSAPTA